MNILVPQLPDDAFQAHLNTIVEQEPFRIFASEILDFIQHISQKILLDPSLRQFPELMSVAYWMRRPNLERIHQEFAQQMQGHIRQPRGTVLHLAPSNVDTIFIYSWFLAMLTGNANIVRLSNRRGGQVNILLKIINEILATDRFAAIRNRTLIVSYDHDSEITEELSKRCEIRVIWGGDETIQRVRSIPLNPLAQELAFADRFSSAALRATAILAAEEREFVELTHAFHNDAFWFDQMACSSPRLVMWIGEKEEIAEAQRRFWIGMETHLQESHYEPPAAVRIRRMTVAYYYGSYIENARIVDTPGSKLTRVSIPYIDEHLRGMHCGGGLFLEMSFPKLPAITAALTSKDQTLSVYGFNQQEVEELARTLPKRSIDRIVPVGQALTFSPIWDGNNLLEIFTREVSVTIGNRP